MDKYIRFRLRRTAIPHSKTTSSMLLAELSNFPIEPSYNAQPSLDTSCVPENDHGHVCIVDGLLQWLQRPLFSWNTGASVFVPVGIRERHSQEQIEQKGEQERDEGRWAEQAQ